MTGPRSLILLVCSASLLALTACGSGFRTVGATVTPPAPAAPAPPPSIWVGAWGSSMANAQVEPQNKGDQDVSYRFLIIPTVGGTQERVHFSNFFGLTPVTIGTSRLSIAVNQNGSPAVDPTHDVPLTFSGQPSITLAPGQTTTSDPVQLTFSLGQTLAVSVYLKGVFGPVDRHDSLLMTNFRTASSAGDTTTDTAGTSFTTSFPDWHMVSELDVYGQYKGTIVLFGTSTTDGFHSNYSSNQLYPVPNTPVASQVTDRIGDQLARRLDAAGYKVGVIDAGISGDTITPDTSNNIQNANDRVARDVLALPNVLSVVSYFGAIDLRSASCKSAPAIETSTTQLLATAHAANVPVFLVTLPPSAFCTNPAQPNFGPSPSQANPYAGGATPGPENGAEVQRAAFNAWVRTTAPSLPGVSGVIDLDQVLADPANPSFLLPPYNSGDNYHPSGAGYAAAAAAIPLSKVVAGH